MCTFKKSKKISSWNFRYDPKTDKLSMSYTKFKMKDLNILGELNV